MTWWTFMVQLKCHRGSFLPARKMRQIGEETPLPQLRRMFRNGANDVRF
jgi:hypothetical protein